jgi:transposase
MRARHRLGKLLQRRALRYPGPGATWMQAHWTWLRALRFDDVCSQAVFADYLAGIELLLARRSTLVATLEAQIPGCSHADVIARLRCFRGIDTLTAAGVCADVGDWRRFPKPKHVSGFLGIVPSEHTSDSKRRQGAITKAGPGHGRRLLVEAAWHYRHGSAIGATLARRQDGQDPRAIAIAWRAQQRLHQRYRLINAKMAAQASAARAAQTGEGRGWVTLPAGCCLSRYARWQSASSASGRRGGEARRGGR